MTTNAQASVDVSALRRAYLPVIGGTAAPVRNGAAEITAAVMEIWYARLKPVDNDAAAYITMKLLELNQPIETVLKAIHTVAESDSQFPNLGMIKELIVPSVKTIIDREVQIVFEWSCGVRSRETIAPEIIHASDRAGGINGYTTADNDYQRDRWVIRYRAAREAALRGDPEPEKVKPLTLPTPETGEPLTAEQLAEKKRKYALTKEIIDGKAI